MQTTRHGRPFWTLLAAGLLLALALPGAAAPRGVPQDELDAAAAMLVRANEAGAVAHAPVETGFAQQKLAAAQVAAGSRRHTEARRLAEQAAVDAELALAKARAAKARMEVQQRSEDNARLRAELLGDGVQR